MAFNHQYPYTDFHELNLDWVLSKVTGLDDRLNEIEHNIELLQEDCQNLHDICDNLTGFINDLLAADQKILKMIASEYDEGTQYDPDFLVRYEGKLYKCKPGQTPGPFNAAYWEETDLGTELGNLLYNYYVSLLPHIADMDGNITELYELYNIIGEEYDPNQTYHAGDMCYYEFTEYMCTASGMGTTGPFDPTKWTAQSINMRLRYIESNTEMIVGLRNMIASNYDPSSSYAKGSYVLFNDKIYKAVKNVPVSWPPVAHPTYWEEVTIGSEFNNKPDAVGEYDNMLVGAAKGIYAGNFNDLAPYILRSISGRGNMAIMNKLIGGSVVWNQLLNKANYPSSTGIFTNNNDGTWTANGTAESTTSVVIETITSKLVVGHKYFVSSGFNSDGSGTTYEFMILRFLSSNMNLNLYKNATIVECGNNSNTYPVQAQLVVRGGTTVNNLKFIPQIIDLTQALGTTIANYIYTLEQNTSGSGVAWFRKYFPEVYYAYSAPTIQSTKVSGKKVVGFNQWDEEWEVGGYDTTTGQKNTATNRIRNKNFIPVIPNAIYYFNNANVAFRVLFYSADKEYISNAAYNASQHNLTIPSDCCYINFQMGGDYGTTYNNDICINLHLDGERDGEYEPYKSTTYDLSGSHLVKRKYALVDLGTLDWQYNSTYQIFLTTISGIKTGLSQIGYLMLCQKYTTVINPGLGYIADKSIGTNSSGGVSTDRIWVQDTALGTDAQTFKTAMSGVYLLYELATPFTETVTNPTLYGIWKLDANNNLYFDGDEIEDIPNPQVVPDGGTEEYIDAAVTDGLRDVSIPAGQDTDYSEDLVKKLEDLPYVPAYADPATDGNQITCKIGVDLATGKRVMRHTYVKKGITINGQETISGVIDMTDVDTIISTCFMEKGNNDGSYFTNIGYVTAAGEYEIYLTPWGNNTVVDCYITIDYIEA